MPICMQGHIQDHAKVDLGIVMPVYPGTLQHVPVPILDDAAIAVIDQVMHSLLLAVGLHVATCVTAVVLVRWMLRHLS